MGGGLAAWFALALLVAASLTEMDRGRVAAGLRWGAARGGAVLLTFVYVCAAWVFFRASTFDSARQIFAQLATLSTDAVNLTPPILLALALGATLHFFPTPTLDWLRRSFVRLPAPARAVVLVAAALVLRSLARPTVVPFIYFQF